jgi:alpha-glucosidase
MRKSVDDLEAALPDFAWPNYVLGNHDQTRLATRFGGQAQARLAAMLLLTLRGTPTLYYGDELGLENGIIPTDKVQDPQGLNLGVEYTRDVCRTPMQWDDSPNAGFSSAEPWLPVSKDYPIRNVAVQSAEPRSILNLYRHLLQLRRDSPALSIGAYQPLDSPANCSMYLRQQGEARVLVALNFADESRTIDLASLASTVPGKAEVRNSTHLDREGMEPLSSIELRPNEGLIIAL